MRGSAAGTFAHRVAALAQIPIRRLEAALQEGDALVQAHKIAAHAPQPKLKERLSVRLARQLDDR